MPNLTTLARVKAYFAITSANAALEGVLSRAIVSESAHVERWCGRKLCDWQQHNMRLNGTGTATMMLPHAPVLGIEALTIGSTAIVYAADGAQAGYSYDDAVIYLQGTRFPFIPQSVACTWDAGWREADTQAIPTGNTPTIATTSGNLPVSVANVVSDTGTVFSAAASNAPAAGEYYFNTAASVFQFNTADANTVVTITYGYVPADVEQAVIEMVGLDMKQRDNIGVKSKSLGQESVTFEDRGMPTSARELLNTYKRRAPV